jgi:hypothetical protein
MEREGKNVGNFNKLNKAENQWPGRFTKSRFSACSLDIWQALFAQNHIQATDEHVFFTITDEHELVVLCSI